MVGHNAAAILTRGIPFGASSISTCGMIYHVVITERAGGDQRKPSKSAAKLPTYKSAHLPRLIDIAVFCRGQVFTEAVMVDEGVEVTVDNIEIVEGEDGLEIKVVGVYLY